MELTVFLNDDLFNNIFSFLFTAILEDYSANVARDVSNECPDNFIIKLTKICKGIRVTTITWKYFFSKHNYRFPNFDVTNNKVWISFAQMEFTLDKRVERCLECMKYFYCNGIDDDTGGLTAHYQFENNEYFVEGPVTSHLFFDSQEFNPRNLSPVFFKNDSNIYDECLIAWNTYIINRKINDYGRDFNLYTRFRIEIYSWEEKFEYKCRFDISTSHFQGIYNENDIRSIIKSMLREGLVPENNLRSKIIF